MSARVNTRGPVPQRASAVDTEPAVAGTLTVDEQVELDDDELADDAEPLPSNVTEEPDGSWLVRLQHPLEPTKDDPTGTDIEKLRMQPRVYARNIRDADRGANGNVDMHLRLTASLCGVPPKTIERLDARDFNVLAGLVNRRQRQTPT